MTVGRQCPDASGVESVGTVQAVVSTSRGRLLARVALVAGLLVFWYLGQASVAQADGQPPSGIGSETVFAIAVSPAYQRTGLVVAETSPLQSCKTDCLHLWVSHDGGAKWAQVPAKGWAGGKPVIGVDTGGHEAMYAGGANLQRSADGGLTWSAFGGPANTATPDSGPRGSDTLAVANDQADYLLTGAASRKVAGSGGKYSDFAFALSPAFPQGGGHSPALLSGIDGNKLPAIQQCSADLTCSGGASLPGAGVYSAPATLLLSSTYATDGVVFAQTGRGIYKSADDARTFVPVPVVTISGAQVTSTPAMALAPGYSESSGNRVGYVSVFAVFTDPKNPRTAGGIYRTTDGGATWASVGSLGSPDSGSQAVAVAPDGRLFAGYLQSSKAGASAGLLCSTDGGSTWKASCPAVGAGAGPVSAAGGSSTGSTSAGGCAQDCGSGPAVADPGAEVAAGAGTGAAAGSAAGHRAGGFLGIPGTESPLVLGIAAAALCGALVIAWRVGLVARVASYARNSRGKRLG